MKNVQDYPVPAKVCRAEITVVNSRFISSVSPAFNVNEAKEFINRIKNEFPDASHHVPAYIIGFDPSVVMHCSDGGEPAGTAGQPILAVLKGSGIGDIAVVVTRYFGGTKLGKGGLVRAYSEGVKAVLNILPLARRILLHQVMFSIPYSFLEQSRRLVSQYDGSNIDEVFSIDITIVARFSPDKYEKFKTEIIDLTNGKVELIILETNYFIVPIQL